MLLKWQCLRLYNNIRIDFSYDGTSFNGYQIQPSVRTVEGEISKAIQLILNEKPKLTSAGRTDTGVHASHQVANFLSKKSIPVHNLMCALNSVLPDDIHIFDIQSVSSSFNSRKSAKSRLYRYLFSSSKPPLWLRSYISYIPHKPFIVDMNICLMDLFGGQRDFINLSKKGSNSFSTIREVKAARIEAFTLPSYFSMGTQSIYSIEIEANGFLYGMVRCIIGALFELFSDKKQVYDFKKLFTQTGKIDYTYTLAPPNGLSLAMVNY